MTVGTGVLAFEGEQSLRIAFCIGDVGAGLVVDDRDFLARAFAHGTLGKVSDDINWSASDEAMAYKPHNRIGPASGLRRRIPVTHTKILCDPRPDTNGNYMPWR